MRIVESMPDVDAVVVDAAGTLHFSAGLLAAATARALMTTA